MRAIAGVVVGAAFAFVIACGGAASKKVTEVESRPPPPGDPRAEIDKLDREISSLMQTLNEPRPAAPPLTCAADCAQAMSGAAETAVLKDPTCTPGASETCKESCTLKDSICTNAKRICTIASDLGGNDAYANDKCNSGSTSCEAAKKRCCSCT
jgi:hypothetical protein